MWVDSHGLWSQVAYVGMTLLQVLVAVIPGEPLEISVPHHLGVNESNAHLAAALAGLGIIQTFGYAARTHLETGALVEVLSDWRPKAYPFHVVYPQSRHLTHRLRVFIAWLAEVFPAAVKG